MKWEYVLNCNFFVWYLKFKNIIIRSWVIFFLKEFVDYFKVDNVVLFGELVVIRNFGDEIESDFDEW